MLERRMRLGTPGSAAVPAASASSPADTAPGTAITFFASRPGSRMVLLLFCLLVSASATVYGATGSGERVVLWSWEHPDDLSALDPKRFSVAYYAATIFLNGTSRIAVKPRMNSLKIAEGTYTLPVFRLENQDRDGKTPGSSDKALHEVVDYISNYAATHHNKEVQIDFDAKQTERGFYLQLLRSLHDKGSQEPHFKTAITALASWCLFDRWLDDAQADEAVAMLFSMGSGQTETLTWLQKHMKLAASPNMIQSIGISIDEPAVLSKLKTYTDNFSSARRIFIFSSKPWTKQRIERVEWTTCSDSTH